MLFILKDVVSMFSKKNLKCHIFHFASVCFKLSLAQRRWLEDKALTCICGWHSDLFSLTVISGSVREAMQ